MNLVYDDVALLYPLNPGTYPHVWRPTLDDMMPPRFAIWLPAIHNYQVFDITRNTDSSITLKPTNTSRENPFYFAIQNDGDTKSRTVTIYNPRATVNTHTDVAFWFTGAWLCKKSSNHSLQAVIPILAASDAKPFKFVKNIGIYPCATLMNWMNKFSPEYMQEMTRRRIVFTSLKPIEDVPEIKPIAPIPLFAATALVTLAIQKGETCPISMEELQIGKAAVTSCYHIFDRTCIQNWMNEHSTCPICKQVCALTEV
jgi:hypothetical protein